MSTLYAAMYRPSWPAISRDLGVLTLFCLLGFTISLAVLPRLDVDEVEFILNYLQ
jgi:hypothetical protein